MAIQTKSESFVSPLVVKNLLDQLREALKVRGRKHHRSLGKEVASIIEQAIRHSDAQSLAQNTPLSAQSLRLHDLELAMSDNQYSHVNSLASIEEAMDKLRGERIDPRQ